MSAFYVGQEVVTRRLKRGRVTAILDNGNVRVAFSSSHDGYEMRPGQLRSASSYDSAGKGYLRQDHR